jgi:hemerythrin-like domain-containing protein
MADVLRLTDRLASDMPQMLVEHKQIVEAVKVLEQAAAEENNADGLAFARMLATHANMEEQVTYPTALLIGRYVRSRMAKGGS